MMLVYCCLIGEYGRAWSTLYEMKFGQMSHDVI